MTGLFSGAVCAVTLAWVAGITTAAAPAVAAGLAAMAAASAVTAAIAAVEVHRQG